MDNTTNICFLPDEIIIIILRNCTPREILNFSSTCKHYNDIAKNHKSLWRYKCVNMFPTIVCHAIEEYYNGNWLLEMKNYCSLQQKLHFELIAMSPAHYWKLSERSLDNVNHFFTIATQTNFFYAVHILQDVIAKTNRQLYKCEYVKPYTLTETYYSKAVLRQFIHTYLSIKWAKANVQQDLPPVDVVNFFLQWIDPANIHTDEKVHKKIGVLVEAVNRILENIKKSRRNCSGLQIIEAVSQVIYKQIRMTLTTASNLETLNICKALDNKCGNVVVVAAVYQAVATRCGACCELIVFPNHLFLEWKGDDADGQKLYNIDLATGEPYAQRQCPFAISQTQPPTKPSYNPNSLLQYIYSSYVITMGALRTWNSQNALQLIGFLGAETDQPVFKHNPYKNYLSRLMENVDTLIHCEKPNIKKLSNDHIQLIIKLTELNNIEEIPTKKKIAKQHASSVKFAVGMICYHKRYDYVCIIRGWDLTGCQLHFPLDDLYFGRSQPFYYITAADQSERYVAQENLMELTRPKRLHHLEHQISRDFTHFDGFAYALNDEKRVEYPEDEAIVEVFRTLCRQKRNNVS